MRLWRRISSGVGTGADSSSGCASRSRTVSRGTGVVTMGSGRSASSAASREGSSSGSGVVAHTGITGSEGAAGLSSRGGTGSETEGGGTSSKGETSSAGTLAASFSSGALSPSTGSVRTSSHGSFESESAGPLPPVLKKLNMFLSSEPRRTRGRANESFYAWAASASSAAVTVTKDPNTMILTVPLGRSERFFATKRACASAASTVV